MQAWVAQARTRPAGLRRPPRSTIRLRLVLKWLLSPGSQLGLPGLPQSALPPHPLCSATSSPAVPHMHRHSSVSGSYSGHGSRAGYIRRTPSSFLILEKPSSEAWYKSHQFHEISLAPRSPHCTPRPAWVCPAVLIKPAASWLCGRTQTHRAKPVNPHS